MSSNVFAVCCSVLQCVAVCCSVLQCVAVSVRPPYLAMSSPLIHTMLIYMKHEWITWVSRDSSIWHDTFTCHTHIQVWVLWVSHMSWHMNESWLIYTTHNGTTHPHEGMSCHHENESSRGGWQITSRNEWLIHMMAPPSQMSPSFTWRHVINGWVPRFSWWYA